MAVAERLCLGAGRERGTADMCISFPPGEQALGSAAWVGRGGAVTQPCQHEGFSAVISSPVKSSELCIFCFKNKQMIKLGLRVARNGNMVS